MIERPQFAVDLGGTWLRLRDLHTGERTERLPSPSVLRFPDRTASELVDDLVGTLSTAIPPNATVAFSCGAALDEQRGVAYGSGPLWGASRESIALRELLAEARPDVEWNLINDVTAGLADFAHRHARPDDRHITYITVSSGIALRTVDMRSRAIFVDQHGLQGEVGHLIAATRAPSAVRELPCACGGAGHIAAISSGPALPAVAAALGIADEVAVDLAAGVRAGDSDAVTLLSTIVEPVAELIRTMSVVDPALDLVGLGGGLVEALADGYESVLRNMLSQSRSYADIGDPPYSIRVCRPGDVDTLAGAATMNEGTFRVVKN